VVAREWFAKYANTWAARHSERVVRLFERDVFPWMGARPVADLTAPELLTVVRRIEERGALETAHRALGNCGQVWLLLQDAPCAIRRAIFAARFPR
jgi:integrase